ncbi:MAG: TonB family protein [Alphaproteobacteria bacterium]|nr:MAG: TonB family protein [Alphaproteobacteria bacterium]
MRSSDFLLALLLAVTAHLLLLGVTSSDKAGVSVRQSSGSFEVPLAVEISLDGGAGTQPLGRPSLQRDEVAGAGSKPSAQPVKAPDPGASQNRVSGAPSRQAASVISRPAAGDLPRDRLAGPSRGSAPPGVLPADKPQAGPPLPQPRPATPMKAERSPGAARTGGRKRQPSGAPGKGSADRRQAAPSTGSIRNYALVLRRWVARHKHYPEEARRRKLQGSVGLWIKIDRRGAVLASRLTRRSGIAALDRATAHLPGRAAPFPAIPPDVNKASFSFTVTLRYALR